MEVIFVSIKTHRFGPPLSKSVREFPYNDWTLRPMSDWPMGDLLKGAAVYIILCWRCLCHGSHPNAVESLGVFRNNFCIIKNLDFVLKYSVYSAIWNRFYVFNAISLFCG